MTTTTKPTHKKPTQRKPGGAMAARSTIPMCKSCGQPSPVVGVDPGARATGIVLVTADGVVSGVSVENPAGPLLPPPVEYVKRVISAVGDLAAPGVVVAVESVTRPSWHVAKSASRGAAGNPTALLGTAVVLGAVLGAYPGAVLVRPGRNGSGPMGVYPEDLVSVGERRKSGWEMRVGSGKLRHQRSAWDVALAAEIDQCVVCS